MAAEEFEVIAGKYDSDELNVKYSGSFVTLDEAIAAYDSVSGYPFAYVMYKGRVMEVWRRGCHPLQTEQPQAMMGEENV